MSQYFSAPLVQAVRCVFSTMRSFADVNMPGTNIPVIAFGVGLWAIYFFYRVVGGNLFDFEVKK